MEELVWLIPTLPLAGFLLLVAFGRRMGEPAAGWLASAMMAGSFAATVVVFAGLFNEPESHRIFTQSLFTWIAVDGFEVSVGLLADPLSITMALFVTGVGALIHLYSIGYMHGDKDFSKFFIYMNLFAFSMLVLVLADNLLLTFVGWEGVGTCSYLLISFWFTDEQNAVAGKKAFVTNRLGDVGFMLGTFVLWTTIGSINYLDIDAAVSAELIAGVTATAIALLFFIAATGKSAQIPLFVWLPDAMAGPTPVSALIHAATMVAAGVFLLVRMSPVLHEAAWANDVIAWVGVITAFVAATIAVAQNDIKKVLAFSTISQLGYMFLAIGTGAYAAAMFHMVTHAFFKALLFLGAGSVIHGMDDRQDMRVMGGLSKFMPLTTITFLVGWLAIAGVPPFSGFWSKDEILASAWAFDSGGAALWVIGLVTALITAFYMSRQVIMVFYGRPHWRDETARTPAPASLSAAAENPGGDGEAELDVDGLARLPADYQPHESPWQMTVPLVFLSLLAVVGGVLNLPFLEELALLENWLEPVTLPHEAGSGAELWALASAATAIALIGIGSAAVIYQRRRVSRELVERRLFSKGWYVDIFYSWFTGHPGRRFFDAIRWFDEKVIDGAANGVAGLVRRSGTALRSLQTGYVRNYALGVAFGTVLLLVYFITRIQV